MSRALLLRNLQSRITRTNVTRGNPSRGLRSIGTELAANQNIVDKALQFFGGFLSQTASFLGWIMRPILSSIRFTFTDGFSLLVNASSFIFNFNWNISNEEIAQQLEQTKLVIAGQLGETVGNAVGFLACGIVPSSAIFAFNEPLGLYLLKEVGEEALDEFASNLQSLITISSRLKARDFFFKSFKNVRKSIKKYVRSQSEEEKTAINNFFNGNITQAIEAWGEKESKPWSFRLALENRIDEISDPVAQEFWEEATESFLEGCMEAGYVIANGLDNWILQQAQEQSLLAEREQTVTLQPDRNAPEEQLIITGNSAQIRNQVVNSLNAFQLVDNRDVGQIIGEPLRDSIRKPPVSLSVRIYLRGNDSPPWIGLDGSPSKRAQVTIPNVNKIKLDWLRIKQAVGGINGYLWGRFLISANLDDGNKISFYAASETEGERIMKQLIDISNANLTTLQILEETKEGARILYPGLYKKTQRVYPAHMTIINQNQILRLDQGLATTRGIYKARRYLIPLYVQTKPEEFELIKAELSRKDV